MILTPCFIPPLPPPGINDAPTPNALAPSIGPRQICPAEGVGLVRHRHHCHPHHCAAIAIAVAAPPKPSLCRHRHRCAATFSAIAAPHRCAAIAALPPQLLRSHRLRRRCATTTSTPVSRSPVNDASASRALVDDANATIKRDE